MAERLDGCIDRRNRRHNPVIRRSVPAQDSRIVSPPVEPRRCRPIGKTPRGPASQTRPRQARPRTPHHHEVRRPRCSRDRYCPHSTTKKVEADHCYLPFVSSSTTGEMTRPADLDDLLERIDVAIAPNLFGLHSTPLPETRRRESGVGGSYDPWVDRSSYNRAPSPGTINVSQVLLPASPDPVFEAWSTLSVRRHRPATTESGRPRRDRLLHAPGPVRPERGPLRQAAPDGALGRHAGSVHRSRSDRRPDRRSRCHHGQTRCRVRTRCTRSSSARPLVANGCRPAFGRGSRTTSTSTRGGRPPGRTSLRDRSPSGSRSHAPRGRSRPHDRRDPRSHPGSLLDRRGAASRTSPAADSSTGSAWMNTPSGSAEPTACALTFSGYVHGERETKLTSASWPSSPSFDRSTTWASPTTRSPGLFACSTTRSPRIPRARTMTLHFGDESSSGHSINSLARTYRPTTCHQSAPGRSCSGRRDQRRHPIREVPDRPDRRRRVCHCVVQPR